MTDPQDSHLVADETIAQHVWMNHCQLPVPSGWPTPIGVLVQTVAGLAQPGRNPFCSRWVELTDISPDTFQIVEGGFGPNYSPHLGGGSSFGVPQDRSHLETAS